MGSSTGKESACNARDPGSVPGWGSSLGEGIGYRIQYSWASLMTQTVKNSPAIWEVSSVAQLCPTLCDPMNCSTPGFPVHHQLWEPTQTHVHRISDAIQPSHPLLSPSPPTFNLSQHQSFPMSQFFASGGQSIRASASTSVLPMNI